MTKTKTSADLEKDIELHEARIRKLTEEKKILNRKKAEQLRRERTHQLCTRGGMVNAFLKEPNLFTDDEVMELLTYAFRQPVVDMKLKALWRDKGVAEERPENQGDLTD